LKTWKEMEHLFVTSKMVAIAASILKQYK